MIMLQEAQEAADSVATVGVDSWTDSFFLWAGVLLTVIVIGMVVKRLRS